MLKPVEVLEVPEVVEVIEGDQTNQKTEEAKKLDFVFYFIYPLGGASKIFDLRSEGTKNFFGSKNIDI